VSIDARELRVSVRDRGPGFDPDRFREPTDDGGWGLDLVRSLSSRWGVDPSDNGTDVWFAIDLSAKPGSPLP
jgi:serine/threonine-protein kinase RsbW